MFSKCGYSPHVNQNVVGVAHSNIAMVIIRASTSTVFCSRATWKRVSHSATPFKSRLRTTAIETGSCFTTPSESLLQGIIATATAFSIQYREQLHTNFIRSNSTAPDKTKKTAFQIRKAIFSLPYFRGVVYILVSLQRSITIRYRVDGVLSLAFLGAEYISLGKYSVFEGSGDRSGYKLEQELRQEQSCCQGCNRGQGCYRIEETVLIIVIVIGSSLSRCKHWSRCAHWSAVMVTSCSSYQVRGGQYYIYVKSLALFHYNPCQVRTVVGSSLQRCGEGYCCLVNVPLQAVLRSRVMVGSCQRVRVNIFFSFAVIRILRSHSLLLKSLIPVAKKKRSKRKCTLFFLKSRAGSGGGAQ